MRSVFIFTFLIIYSMQIFAHEGHNKTPGVKAAPHGGILKGTDNTYVELVSSKSGIKIYPLDHDMKPLKLGPKGLTATYVLPPPKVADKLVLDDKGDHFSGNPNVKGSYKYDLLVTVDVSGKTEKVKFTVEP